VACHGALENIPKRGRCKRLVTSGRPLPSIRNVDNTRQDEIDRTMVESGREADRFYKIYRLILTQRAHSACGP
jgi:hypothetical protein